MKHAKAVKGLQLHHFVFSVNVCTCVSSLNVSGIAGSLDARMSNLTPVFGDTGQPVQLY